MHKFEHWRGCKHTGLLILRVVLGAYFVIHGILKFQNMEGTIAFFASLGFASFFAYLVATLETLGGFLLAIGLFTRVSAVLLSVVMLVAIFKVKLPMGGLMGIELEVLYLAGLLSLLFVGSGRYSMKGAFCKCNSCKTDCDCSATTCNNCDDNKQSMSQQVK